MSNDTLPGGCYPAFPLPVPDYGTVLPTLEVTRTLKGAKIFTGLKKANKFMETVVVEDVQITELSAGILIVVFYEVGEANE